MWPTPERAKWPKACCAINTQLRERQPYLGAWTRSSFEQGALCALAALSSNHARRCLLSVPWCRCLCGHSAVSSPPLSPTTMIRMRSMSLTKSRRCHTWRNHCLGMAQSPHSFLHEWKAAADFATHRWSSGTRLQYRLTRHKSPFTCEVPTVPLCPRCSLSSAVAKVDGGGYRGPHYAHTQNTSSSVDACWMKMATSAGKFFCVNLAVHPLITGSRMRRNSLVLPLLCRPTLPAAYPSHCPCQPHNLANSLSIHVKSR